MKPTTDPLQDSDIFSAIAAAPCGANWFALATPCHRVTAADALGRFSKQDDEHGFHLGVKRWLLSHEGGAAPWRQQAMWT